jgi:hypothetical protein
VSQPSVNLTAKVGAQASAEVKIANHGNGILEGSVSGPSGSPFSSTGTGPFTFSRGNSKRVKVTFAPTMVGKFSSELIITSDDREHPSVNLPVTGTSK